MTTIATDDPLAEAAVEAIHTGAMPTLKRLLNENPELATARLGDDDPRTTLQDAATLGLMDRVEATFAGETRPSTDEVNSAFWGACHGGQRAAAKYLIQQGADPSWIPPWENLTLLDAARRSEADELVEWLRGRGARAAGEIG